MVIVTILNIK